MGRPGPYAVTACLSWLLSCGGLSGPGCPSEPVQVCPSPPRSTPPAFWGKELLSGIPLLCSSSWRGAAGQEGCSRVGFLLVWGPVGAAVGKLLVPAGRAGPGRGSPSAALPTLASGHVLVAEILVLGTGDRVERLHPAMLKHMRESGIAVEVQDTVRRGVQRGAYRQRPSERGGGGTGNPP